ncbi:MAG: response regulator [Deltaproteobacteria bacterium]|nr:response regulator [Deltaproteobacteria bacterium]
MSKRRVLIADDLLFFRAALRDILERGGYEVIGEAANGAEAFDKARTLSPDIVILDVVMPVKTGIDAAREISHLNMPLKIVMCSSLGYEPIVEEAIRAGACAYILKPLNEEAVLQTLVSLEADTP